MNELGLHADMFRLKENASSARAYFYTWWAMRNRALPKYRDVMRDSSYVDFFHVANSGFLQLTFVSLGKLIDRDQRAVQLAAFRKKLLKAGFVGEADRLSGLLCAHSDLIERVRNIRNKSVAHNEALTTRDSVYERYGVTPDELRELIGDVCDTLNAIDEELGSPTRISDGTRHEEATLELLDRLKQVSD